MTLLEECGWGAAETWGSCWHLW